ncbi:hypothetical protein H6F75_26930 [Nodosilinea sp. FACHB-131]|uniref:hypothetical protein n=1 Tax=Cyanophyceae TaxID=3028117 RepID=UPI001688E42A|nr:hypothetical protein [Nodosilinea sp. FACHB-131]MBD1877123.1 hypothetical protein [Nodosilinea sp. FACHB-131]
MIGSLIVFDEPSLEFRYGQRVSDPHDGLSLFGPFDADESSSVRLSYIAIGTGDGLDLLEQWLDAINQPAILREEGKEANLRLWPPYPGFEAAFAKPWPEKPNWTRAISASELSSASRTHDQYQRANAVVDYYLNEIKLASSKLDPTPNVAICVVPDEVYKNCRPKSKVQDATGEKVSRKTINSRKTGQLELLSDVSLEVYNLSPDFRRQLKARSMEYGIPIQIVRESTLQLTDKARKGKRQLTPISDRMWNISTALYYKCGGKPWRLVTAREGVCYIGIAFRRSEDEKTACCAAQMFLNNGDGIVFLGDFGPWYSSEKEQFKLSRQAAKKLLEGTLKTYKDLGGKELKEIFLHSRSYISPDEFAGYKEACPSGIKLSGIRVRRERRGGLRLYGDQKTPLLRGSFLKNSERSGFLWASGFKTRLATYDGWETPVPLKIDIIYGDAIIERVAQDIFGLTKLNYNACRLGESQPVTVKFSDAVGEILISNPTVEKRRHNFKFYI